MTAWAHDFAAAGQDACDCCGEFAQLDDATQLCADCFVATGDGEFGEFMDEFGLASPEADPVADAYRMSLGELSALSADAASPTRQFVYDEDGTECDENGVPV